MLLSDLKKREVFRAILYHPALTWGSKCLAMAILDSPGESWPKNAVLARRLQASPGQVSKWTKELLDKNITLNRAQKRVS